MINLPSNLFQRVSFFCTPKEIFSSKGVCKEWYKQCSQPELWEGVAKIHHPGFEMPSDYEKIMRSLHLLPKLEDFEFVLTFAFDGVHIFTHKFTKEKESIALESKKLRLIQNAFTTIENSDHPYDLDVRMYVTLKGASLQVRQVSFNGYMAMEEEEGGPKSL